VNDTLQEMKTDKTYEKIYCKWFGTDKTLLEEACPEKSHISYHKDYYIVQKDDNLWDLSEKFYGTPYNWKHIREANAPPVLIEGTIADIREGKKLRIPKLPE